MVSSIACILSFQILLFIVCTQLNGFKYCLHFIVSNIAIYCLHTVKWFQVLLAFYRFKYCYLLFVHSYMVSSIVNA